jgi:uncharacterized protein (UPF0261 family)
MSAATRAAVTTAISNLVEAMVNFHTWQRAPDHQRLAGTYEDHERTVTDKQVELDEALADFERSIKEDNE